MEEEIDEDEGRARDDEIGPPTIILINIYYRTTYSFK